MRSQKLRKFRREIDTRFRKIFGEDTAGILLFFAKNMKNLMNLVQEMLKGLDPRKRSVDYTMDDFVWTVVLMFVLRAKSRNNMNEIRKSKEVQKLFKSVFSISLPHMDTCHEIMEKLDSTVMGGILTCIMKYFLARKLFSSSKYNGNISVILDASGLGGVEVGKDDLRIIPIDIGQANQTQQGRILFKEGDGVLANSGTKINTTRWATGKTKSDGDRFFVRSFIILRVIGPNGISIAVDWEPINTEDGSTKEDCEQNSAKRLLTRFRSNFKRLGVNLIADGLYANKTFMELAKDLKMNFIYTLKNDSLKNIWKQVDTAFDLNNNKIQTLIPYEKGEHTTQIVVQNEGKDSDVINNEYKWINDLSHAGISLNWCSVVESVNDSDEKYYFSVITNLKLTINTVESVMKLARSRFLVEDAFNTQKNRGFESKHKYSQNSDQAAKNYITLMLVAETVTNVVLLSDWVQRSYLKDDKKSIISLMDEIRSMLKSGCLKVFEDKYSPFIPNIITYTMLL